MDKNLVIKKQQFKFMLLNFIAFTIIFSIFGVIIFSQVQSTLYKKTDEELLMTMDRIVNAREQNGLNRFPPLNAPADDRPRNIPAPSNRDNGILPTPRLIMLHWDQDYMITNQMQIGSQLYENYVKDIQFDAQAMGTIKQLKINDAYSFRTITFYNNSNNSDNNNSNSNDYIKKDASDIYATQLLINVDAEEAMIANFERIIILCSVIFMLLSISASYILSKKTMKPIINAWQRQIEFVENASHELRTPLTIVQNKLEMLLTMPNTKIVDNIDAIAMGLSETRRLSKLTNDLLTLARADSSTTQLSKQLIDIEQLILPICSPYAEIATSQHKQFDISINCKTKIEVDTNRIHQLLVILLDNALKYTKGGDRLGINAYCKENNAIIEVRDTGIGIKEQNLVRIFDRFYREEEGRSREFGGVGLGLAIAKWIVNIHQGTISVKSDNTGTVFTVKLPL